MHPYSFFMEEEASDSLYLQGQIKPRNCNHVPGQDFAKMMTGSLNQKLKCCSLNMSQSGGTWLNKLHMVPAYYTDCRLLMGSEGEDPSYRANFAIFGKTPFGSYCISRNYKTIWNNKVAKIWNPVQRKKIFCSPFMPPLFLQIKFKALVIQTLAYLGQVFEVTWVNCKFSCFSIKVSQLSQSQSFLRIVTKWQAIRN